MNTDSAERKRSGRLALFRRVAGLVCGIALLACIQQTASSHAAFESSDPAMNAIVATAPPEVRIRFTEPLENTYTRATLLDQSGEEVSGTSFAIEENDRHELVLTLPESLPNGTYTVSWQNLSSADGHRLQGFFAFTIGTAADVGAAAGVSLDDDGPPFWLGGVARWSALLGIALVVSILPMWLFVLAPSLAGTPEFAASVGAKLKRLALVAVGVAIAANVFALVIQTAGNAGDESVLSVLWSTTFDTRYGRYWLLRLGLLVVLGVVFAALSWNNRPERRPLAALGLAAAAALPFPVSMLAHASAQVENRFSAIAADYVHLLGAAIWGGGLFVLTLAIFPAVAGQADETGRSVLSRIVPRFSILGIAAWVTAGLTGLYMAYLQVGSWDGLRDTAYGDSLILKLVALAPALLLAAANLLLLGPRLRRPAANATSAARRLRWTIVGEAAFVVVALFFVGRLVGQQPAREVVAARQPDGTTIEIPLVTQDEPRPSELTISPNLPGPNSYRLEVGGSPLPDGTDGVLRMEPTGGTIGQKELTLARVGDSNTYTGTGSELALAGNWSIEVIVRKPGTLEGRTTVPLTLGGATIGESRADFWRVDWPGLVGLGFLVFGVTAVAGAWLLRTAPWRRQGAVGGGLGVAVGALLIYGALISPTDAESGNAIARAGTPVAKNGIEVTLASNFGAIGQNNVTVTVVDEDGAPVDDATVSIDGEMPEMGMTLVPLSATSLGSGQYQIDAVPITMSGEWRLDVTVERPDEDSVTIPFVLPVGV